MTTARFRMNRSTLLPVVLLALCALPIASGAPWALVFLLVPLLAAGWVLRSGVDVGEQGITARSLFGSRTVTWPDVLGIRIAERGDMWLVTAQGTEVRLPALRARDLPALSRVSGGRIDVPGPPPVPLTPLPGAIP